MQIGDHVTILRDGKYVSDADVKDIDVPWIVREMTGGAKGISENVKTKSGLVKKWKMFLR